MAQVPVLGSAGGAITDSFRVFPAAFRTGWPALFLPWIVSMGLARIVTEAGGRTEMVGWVLIPVLIFLFMPVYVNVISHVATGTFKPGWFSYLPGGRALMATVSLVLTGALLALLSAVLLAPMALALTAELATIFNEVVDEAEGIIGLFGLREELWFIRDIPLQESPIGAGVLAMLGLLGALWLWVKTTFIVPHAALTGAFLPLWTSMRMTWGNFWSVLAACVLFAIVLTVVAPVLLVVLGYFMSLSLGLLVIPDITETISGYGLFQFAGIGLFGLWLSSAFAAFHGRLYRAAAGT